VTDASPLDHMALLLRRAPEREAAFERFIDALHDASSPHYHRWLDAAEIGAGFGPPAADVTKIIGWLNRHGFRVNFVYPDNLIRSARRVAAVFTISCLVCDTGAGARTGGRKATEEGTVHRALPPHHG
jgi:Pro-kumamolisin, activation domain